MTGEQPAQAPKRIVRAMVVALFDDGQAAVWDANGEDVLAEEGVVIPGGDIDAGVTTGYEHVTDPYSPEWGQRLRPTGRSTTTLSVVTTGGYTLRYGNLDDLMRPRPKASGNRAALGARETLHAPAPTPDRREDDGDGTTG